MSARQLGPRGIITGMLMPMADSLAIISGRRTGARLEQRASRFPMPTNCPFGATLLRHSPRKRAKNWIELCAAAAAAAGSTRAEYLKETLHCSRRLHRL